MKLDYRRSISIKTVKQIANRIVKFAINEQGKLAGDSLMLPTELPIEFWQDFITNEFTKAENEKGVKLRYARELLFSWFNSVLVMNATNVLISKMKESGEITDIYSKIDSRVENYIKEIKQK